MTQDVSGTEAAPVQDFRFSDLLPSGTPYASHRNESEATLARRTV